MVAAAPSSTSSPAALNHATATTILSPAAILAHATAATSSTLTTHCSSDMRMGDYFSLSWIIDTGASHHVTGDESSLLDTQSILPCPVVLPNGAQAVATKEGRVF